MDRAGAGEDMASLVAFLAGPDAAYIAGQATNVGGGLVMSWYAASSLKPVVPRVAGRCEPRLSTIMPGLDPGMMIGK